MKLVDLKAMAIEDRQLAISPPWSDVSLLQKSLHQSGLQSPLLVTGPASPGWRIVCGFRRVKAASLLGWKELPCRIVQDESDSNLFLRQLWDNLPTRRLSEIEQARAVERLHSICGLSDEEITAQYLPLIAGLKGGRRLLRRFRRIDRLLDSLKVATESGLLMETALLIAGWDSDEQQLVIELCEAVRPGRNRQRSLIELLTDLRQRDELSAPQLWTEVAGPATEALAAQPGLFDEALKRLRRRRYPRLSSQWDAFRALRRDLRLPASVRLNVPAFFEGDRVTVQLEAASAEQLRMQARSVADSGPGLDEIFGLL